MNAQGYYNLLIRSAVDGTFPSHDGSVCVYRGDRTSNCKKRCAVGVLIPDHYYTPAMEDCGCDEEWWGKFKSAINLPPGMNQEDLREVQNAHDNAAKQGKWHKEVFLQKINALDCFAQVNRVEVLPHDDGVGTSLAPVCAGLPGSDEDDGMAVS